jgi:hypothetical protein
VDRQIRELVEAAEARAAEIEDQALEKASEIVREAERQAGEIPRVSIERAQSVLAAIDSLESQFGEAARSLRSEAKSLDAELRAAMVVPSPSGLSSKESMSLQSEPEDIGDEPSLRVDSDAAAPESPATESNSRDPEAPLLEEIYSSERQSNSSRRGRRLWRRKQRT